MLHGKYIKRSFLRFKPEIDSKTLVSEFSSIPGKLWTSSYWGGIHSSVGMLLLRGGNQGTEDDFTCEGVIDHDFLNELPYISNLINASGPFGTAKYAFIFRMIPNGVTKVHQDLSKVWADMFRIHIPITTNKEAVLISEKKMMHFSTGHAWSFDNNSKHGVVNGNTERVHLIFDVPLNKKLKRQLDLAEFLEGWEDDSKHKIICTKGNNITTSYPGDVAMKETIRTLKSYGWDLDRIANFLNKRDIPAKEYGSEWSAEAICRIIPIISL